jgi:predicted DCC family thiol-disulfide oxidoreductase YuxK
VKIPDDADGDERLEPGASASLRIYYDGECPFCTRYVSLLRLRKTGKIELIDLRKHGRTRRELESSGFDVDRGMVVETGGRRYGGADAMAYLAALTSPSDLLNRLNRILFSSRVASTLLYPVLRSGRR